MFRQEALAKLQSPEKLNEPLKVIRRKNLLASGTMGFLVLIVVLWCILGYVPETGHGQGILIIPNSIVPIQVQGEGHVVQWFVKAGDVVKKDQVIGILEQPAIKQELDRSSDRLEEIKQKNLMISQLRDRYSSLEQKVVEKNRENLQSRITYLEKYIAKNRSMSEVLYKKNSELLHNELTILTESKKDAVLLAGKLEERLKSYERLWLERLTPEESIKSARQNYQDAIVEIRNLELKIKELDLKKVQGEEEYRNMKNLIAARENTLTSLKVQLQELNSREAQLDKTDRELEFQRKNEEEDIERHIEKSRKMLTVNKEIRSAFSGRLLELTVTEGQVVNPGHRVALLNRLDISNGLYALAYFKAEEGKKLLKNAEVQVSPSIVSRNQYGSIIGNILSISDYPVTAESAINYVGNPLVAEALLAGDHQIEVLVSLKRNEKNPSGYEWTSERGPEIPITNETTASVWVVIEQRAPISYVLPKIKEWLGL